MVMSVATMVTMMVVTPSGNGSGCDDISGDFSGNDEGGGDGCIDIGGGCGDNDKGGIISNSDGDVDGDNGDSDGGDTKW